MQFLQAPVVRRLIGLLRSPQGIIALLALAFVAPWLLSFATSLIPVGIDPGPGGSLKVGPPPGPMRLSDSERAAVLARLSNEFKGQIPTSTELPALQGTLFQLKEPDRCQFNKNLAVSADACNDLRSANPVFYLLLKYMHSKTQHMMIGYAPTSRPNVSGRISVYMFMGRSGHPQ